MLSRLVSLLVVLCLLSWAAPGASLWLLVLSPFVVGLVLPPGCCCPTCTIFTDDFSTDRTGTDYSITGTPVVSGGVLTTTSAGFLAIENTAGSTGHGRATITGKVDTLGGSVRVIGSYTDSSNHAFTELVVNGASSTVKLWKKVAGVDTLLGLAHTFTGSLNTNYSLQLCWNGTTATGGVSTISFTSGAYTGTGNQAGFGASPNGGTATFDSFTFSKEFIDDATCTPCGTSCVNCNEKDLPNFLLTFNANNWQPNTTPATNCANIGSASYVLTPCESPQASAESNLSSCDSFWEYRGSFDPGGGCGARDIYFLLRLTKARFGDSKAWAKLEFYDCPFSDGSTAVARTIFAFDLSSAKSGSVLTCGSISHDSNSVGNFGSGVCTSTCSCSNFLDTDAHILYVAA